MGIILVYDCTDEQSFNNIRNWIKQIETHAAKDVAKILVGNKCDREDEKVISTEQGKELADEYGLRFFETSAKSGFNISELFHDVAQTIIKSKPAVGDGAGPKSIQIGGKGSAVKKPESDGGCCGGK